MWDFQSLPWARLQQLETQKDKIKMLLGPLSLITVILILDYCYVVPADDSMFSHSLLALVTTGCLVMTTYSVYKYVQCDSEIHKLRNNDLISEQKRRNIEKSKELLKRAGINSSQKITKSTMSMHENYRPSYPMYENYASPPSQPLKLNIKPFDYVDDVAEEFMRSKGLDKNIRKWIQNVKLWYSKQFLPLILENYETNLKNLNSLLRESTRDKDKSWIYAGTFDDESISVSYEESMYFRRASMKDVQELAIEKGCNYAEDLEKANSHSLRNLGPEYQQAMMRVNFVNLIKQRMLFEKYFDVPGYSCKGYIIQRLRALGKSTCLSEYASNSGGFYRADVWTAKKPTDSHLLSHVFFCLLNNGNNPNFTPDKDIFADIIISYPRMIPNEDHPHRVWFYQKNPESALEPHFEIVSGREVWPTFKGNDNLFCAIALFLHHVKTKSQGYFLHMNCSELLELIA